MKVYEVIVSFDNRNRIQRFKLRLFAELCYYRNIRKYALPVSLTKITSYGWLVSTETLKEWSGKNDH